MFSFVGTWVQDVGESWLMLSLTKSPLPVAMLTTAMTVPMFALLIPAGAMADRLDRRRLLMASQGVMTVAAFGLAVVTWLGRATPAALLVASAGLGVGSALSSPAWNSLVPELVPRSETADAVTLNAMAFNIARAVGPAIGGLILAASGPGVAFFVNAMSFLGVIEVLRRFDEVKRASRRARATEGEREPLSVALFAAFVQLRDREKIRALHVAVATFGFSAASVPALLPVFAKDRLRTTGSGYGLLLGAIGCGAVFAALVLKRLRPLVTAKAMVSGAMAAYGVMIIAMSATRSLPLAIVLLVPAGMAWLTVFSTLNALLQLSTPARLKSRALALYQFVFYGAWSLGALAGGALADRVGSSEVITIAAIGTLAAAALSTRLAIPSHDGELDPLDARSAPVSVRAP